MILEDAGIQEPVTSLAYLKQLTYLWLLMTLGVTSFPNLLSKACSRKLQMRSKRSQQTASQLLIYNILVPLPETSRLWCLAFVV